ncbi:unnamed protein product [Adineta ricciae]|uniref:Uncharacterized protein n=1 Tax=Adineta ricciae TaxID=249248 RepID=A0A814UGW2_ADIRI|nr:unnamed protein product [Adineta ricciae]
MSNSSDLIDSTSRLKQFSWEQWDNQTIAVIFRPGKNGLDRYVLKRYVETVLVQSNRWKALSFYFSQISPAILAYPLTKHEVELMRDIFKYHLQNESYVRILQLNNQVIEFEALLDLTSRAQQLTNANPNALNRNYLTNGNKPVIPCILSTYTLPLTTKNPISSPTTLPSRVLQSREPSTNAKISNLYSKATLSPDLHLALFVNAKVDGTGWVQINNVYLPFLIKHRQRLVPHQILVACKILQSEDLRSVLIRASPTDVTLLNSMIRECKINNEQIPENALLINVRHVLVGTKNLVYAKILLKDDPTAKINRQYKSVLATHGGSMLISTQIVPFVCTTNYTYVPFDYISSNHPNLHPQLKKVARVPHTNELDYLQLVRLYYNDKELPSNALVIDIEHLKQVQLVPSKTISLFEHHAKEKSTLEQQIIRLNNAAAKKRKHPNKKRDNQQLRQKLKTSNDIHPVIGYCPASITYKQPNNPQHGQTHC